MRRAAVAGIAALSIAGGSVAVAAVVPVATALAQDSGATTTTVPGTTTPAPATKGEHPAAGKALDGILGSLVTDGTITQDQADKIKARFGEAATKAREGMAAKRDDVRRAFGAKVDEIATFLGISADDLKTQLKTKSLGEIAGDKKPALITFLTDAVNKRVDEAVTSGKLTQAQADKLKADTAARVTKLVDLVGGKGLAGTFGGPRRGR